MDYRESRNGNVQIIELAGKMMGDPSSAALVKRVDALLAAGVKMVVMDVNEVQWMNSQAISHLIACLTKLRRIGGDLRLAGAAGKVEYYLRLTKLNTVIRTFATQHEAIESFLKEPPDSSLPLSLAERRMGVAA